MKTPIYYKDGILIFILKSKSYFSVNDIILFLNNNGFYLPEFSYNSITKILREYQRNGLIKRNLILKNKYHTYYVNHDLINSLYAR